MQTPPGLERVHPLKLSHSNMPQSLGSPRPGGDEAPSTPNPYKFVYADGGDADALRSGQATPVDMAPVHLSAPQLSQKLLLLSDYLSARKPAVDAALPLSPAAFLPPPPPPPSALLRPPAADQPAQGSAAEATANGGLADVVSLGTVGHPFSCAEACKYRKRKSGCLLGAQCLNCHFCHWRRERAERAMAAAQKASEALREASEQRAPTAEASAQCAPTTVRPPPGLEAEAPLSLTLAWAAALMAPEAPPANVRALPSVARNQGSIGHPTACSWPCKYNSKSRGCLETNCARCHLCQWSRGSEKEKRGMESGGRR